MREQSYFHRYKTLVNKKKRPEEYGPVFCMSTGLGSASPQEAEYRMDIHPAIHDIRNVKYAIRYDMIVTTRLEIFIGTIPSWSRNDFGQRCMREEHESLFTESSTMHERIVDTYLDILCSLASTVKA
jgi:hypothetical protein